MSRTFIMHLFISVALLFTATSVSAQTTVADSVLLTSGYANQVFYSLVTGQKTSVDKNNWDIAFQATGLANAGIWINSASSPISIAYQIPNADSSDWGTLIDTTGYATWQRLQNGTESWAQGAFNTNSTPGGFDYGWGVYSGGPPHNVNGDSLYLLKLTDGSFKVLFLEQLNGAGNYYKFRFADIDGTNAVVDSISKNVDRNLVYYNLRDGEEVDREPSNNEWDLLFTTGLTANVVAGPPGTPPSAPSGVVYTNRGLSSVKVTGVPTDSADYTTATFDTSIYNIANSYVIRNSTPPPGFWQILDSTTYFVKAKNEHVYKIVFTEFGGTGDGKIAFNKTQLTFDATGISDAANATRVALYPNPATSQLNVVLDAKEAGLHQVTITDLAGKVTYSTQVSVNGLQNISIPVSTLANGYYLVSVEANGNRSVQKFVKQ